jgi:hypothetical protein
MDPMAMQNMMMSGGFGGAMGMNGMNMGMGMTGFDGGAGAGFNNGWNGQQSWNVGQDNFNHPNAAGMGHGDYGSNNSGYNSQSAGYNQGNYGRGQYNDYQNNSYGYRGRGRGRGYNRGGYGSGSHDQFSQQYPQQFGSSQANGLTSENGFVPTGPKATVPDANAGDVDEFGREIRHKTEAEEVAPDDPEKPKDEEAPADANDTTDIGEKNGDPTEVKEDTKEVAASFDDSYPKPIQTLDEVESVSYGPNGTYNAASRGGFSGGFQGRANNFNNNQAPFVKPVDVPLNAPTGPKAMRAGLPNTGISGLRASQAFSTASTAPSVARVNGSASVAPEPTPPEKDSKEKERSRSPSRERSRSRERKRSRSRDRHGRSHRHRSRTPLTEEEKETERRRERRRKEKDERRERDRRDRHSRKEDGDDYEEILDKPVDDGVKEGRIVEERSRSASPSDSKRSSHRSRRDKEKYRERDREDRDKYRDDDREYRSSHKHRSTRRHHDDRSRSRDRSRDRDREHRHRRSRHASEEYSDRASKADKSIPPTPIEAEAPPLPAAPSRRPSTNGIGIEIKGASSRRKASTILEEKEPIAIPTGPRGDRNNARILQEKENNKPSSRRHEDEDRHRSSRHRDSDRPPSTSTSNTNPTPKPAPRAPAQPISAPPVQDPHTLEREARNRERLLKEAQRIAGMTGMAAGRKRSRDDGEDTSARMGGKGRNKKRGRGEESDEARIARLEAEREGARWG